MIASPGWLHVLTFVWLWLFVSFGQFKVLESRDLGFSSRTFRMDFSSRTFIFNRELLFSNRSHGLYFAIYFFRKVRAKFSSRTFDFQKFARTLVREFFISKSSHDL